MEQHHTRRGKRILAAVLICCMACLMVPEQIFGAQNEDQGIGEASGTGQRGHAEF